MRKGILFILFLAMLAGVGLTDLVASEQGWRPPGQAHQPASMLNEFRLWKESFGHRDIEQNLINGSYIGSSIGAMYNELTYMALRRIPDEVAAGREGWLFRRENTISISPRLASEAAAIAAEEFAVFSNEFEANGIHLILLLTPGKERLYRDMLDLDDVQTEGRDIFWNELQAYLDETDVDYLSLESVLDQARRDGVQTYFRDDHHWTWIAAQRVAQAAYDQAMQHDLETPPARLAHDHPFEMETLPRPAGSGSVLRYLNLRTGSVLHDSLRDDMEEYEYAATEGGGFLDAVEPRSVVVQSSSFGVHFGHPEYLANLLGERIYDHSIAAMGSYYGLYKLVSVDLNPHARERRPRLVVWDIPEYHLLRRYMTFISLAQEDRARMGAQLFINEIRPIEDWQLSAVDNSAEVNEMHHVKPLSRRAQLRLDLASVSDVERLALEIRTDDVFEVAQCRIMGRDGVLASQLMVYDEERSSWVQVDGIDADGGMTIEISCPAPGMSFDIISVNAVP